MEANNGEIIYSERLQKCGRRCEYADIAPPGQDGRCPNIHGGLRADTEGVRAKVCLVPVKHRGKFRLFCQWHAGSLPTEAGYTKGVKVKQKKTDEQGSLL